MNEPSNRAATALKASGKVFNFPLFYNLLSNKESIVGIQSHPEGMAKRQALIECRFDPDYLS